MLDKTVETRWKNNVIERQDLNSTNGELFSEFNKVFVSGRIEEDFEYSHRTFWKEYYRTRVRITRLSGTDDLVPIVVSNLVLSKEKIKKSLKGKWVEVAGQFRSYNRLGEDGRKHLDLFLYVTLINIYDNKEEMKEIENVNSIYLKGYLCKKPIYRITPLGSQITEVFIAVNRPNGESDYIPCITWDRDAKWSRKLEVGNQVEIYGRIQSRKYFKRYSPDTDEGKYKETYEISTMRIQKV